MSILSTNNKLIKVGQDYSAGDNIDIYEQGEQLYISSKDWKQDIANASANAYNEAVSQIPSPFDPSYISGQVDNKLDTTAFTNWQNGQYSTDLQTIEGQINNKLDTSSFSDVSGSFLTAHQSLDGYATEDWVTAQGYITGVDLSPYYTTAEANSLSSMLSGAIDYVSANADNVEVTNVVHSNSGTWNDVSAKVDTTALNSIVDSNTISYSAKPTADPIYADKNDLKNVNSIQGKSNLAIIPSTVLQVPNVITAAPNGVLNVPGVIISYPNGLTANGLSADANDGLTANGLTADANYGLTAKGFSADANYGLTAKGLTADANDGLTANGITADATMSGFSANGISVGKRGQLCIEGQYGVIYAKGASGFTFSSQNTNFGTAQLTTSYSNQLVNVPSPKFEARNIYGAGFSIEASGAKGYNESGNVVWDTNNPQVKNIISYGDTKTEQGGLNGNIILTVMPSTNASNLTSSPYVIMDASQASYFAAYGPSAQTPTIKLKPDAITFDYAVGNAKTTVGYNDIKQESGGSAWTLTGSIQKRELEYDAETSAITAIAGSAIGGGVTGEFVPQSAFDELKQSYDALSSLFATYSGQWLLPNEGV